MEINNKKILTRKMFEKNNRVEKILGIISILILVSFVTGVILMTKNMPRTFENIAALSICYLFILIPLILCEKEVIKKIKQIVTIEKGNFKIVEDKIYDKNCQSVGDDNFYSVYTKIYGKIGVSYKEYKVAQKDDFMYFLFCDGEEINNTYVDNKENFIIELLFEKGSIEKEARRNSKFVKQKYFKSEYVLSPELSEMTISYNQKLGDSNYDSRIKRQINELEEKKGKVTCKKCSNTYKLNKYDVCPNCSSKYKFDIIDVMHEKEWYK